MRVYLILTTSKQDVNVKPTFSDGWISSPSSLLSEKSHSSDTTAGQTELKNAQQPSPEMQQLWPTGTDLKTVNSSEIPPTSTKDAVSSDAGNYASSGRLEEIANSIDRCDQSAVKAGWPRQLNLKDGQTGGARPRNCASPRSVTGCVRPQCATVIS